MKKNILETTVTSLQDGSTMPLGWALLGWALAIALCAAFFMMRNRLNRLNSDHQRAALEQARLSSRLEEFDATQDALNFERGRTADLEKKQVELTTQLQERERHLNEMTRRFENDFQAIASRLLGSAHEAFLERANETFEKHNAAAQNSFENRQKAVDELIKPMRETLGRYEAGLREMRDNQKKAQGELSGQIEVLAKSASNVQTEAAKLATALKSGSRTRGRWGEEQLRNVVEMTGLSAYCDFTEQKSVQDGDKLKMPDMVVRLPGERVIAVDSKVSLSAYLDAAGETDDAARQVFLLKHAEEMRAHVRSLASKDYAGALRKSNSLDFVVMFIPGENFFAAALEARPELFQEAFDKGVLMATPTTLIAILKSIAYGWRQEKASQNAHKVAGLAQELYGSMRLMGNNLTAIGKSLETTVKNYNKTLGNIEGSVMPKARKFAEYEMPGTEEDLALLEPLETDVREPRQDRDMLFTEEDLPRQAIS
ncbi:DNA recombination protein RmuC [Parvularcula sp. IMCC14364]|uniref:DNA recombination protein RmuC n=1 Tax=Parvularcula sp. IMCC14364 TaxID=3067902 RepID=UPI0027404D6D|nr:DNA recombination protein RmuC [Parvularcula sp. IMCC14364]